MREREILVAQKYGEWPQIRFTVGVKRVPANPDALQSRRKSKREVLGSMVGRVIGRVTDLQHIQTITSFNGV